MKNYSLKIALSSAILLALSACSAVDLNTNPSDKTGEQGVSDNGSIEPSIQVESVEKLPNCGQKREGVAAEVGDEIYVCSEGRWDKQESNSKKSPQKAEVKVVESEDDLTACTSKNEGVLTIAGKNAFKCSDRKWENLGVYAATEDDLLNCTEKRDGDVSYLASEGVSYICEEGRWERVDRNFVPETYSSSSSYNGVPYDPTPVVYPTIDPNIMYPIYSSSSVMVMPTFPVYSSSSVAIMPTIPVYSSSSVVVVPTPTPVVSSSSMARSSSSRARSSSSVAPVITTTVCGDMWCGPYGDIQVQTGLDKSSKENAGYWWTYDDNDDGGESRFVWPTSLGDEFGESSFTPVIEECGGVCGKYSINQGVLEYQGYVGVAFNIGGANSYGEPYVVNASAWDGVCVVYTSDMDITLEMGLGSDYDKALEYDVPTATLLASKSTIVKNITWSSFKQGGWGNGGTISGTAASKKIASLKFKFQGEDGVGNFNIMSIGTYGSCQ